MARPTWRRPYLVGSTLAAFALPVAAVSLAIAAVAVINALSARG